MHSILVIEDEPNILANTIDILRFEGYAVLEADNGRLGIELARANRPDLILCDIMMPDNDGYTVLKAIRSHEDTRHIPLVLMSARNDQTTLQLVGDLGATDYLAKPFTVPELLAVIQRHLTAGD